MIKVEHLYKVFGKKPEQALQLLEENHSREDIREKTGQILALDDVSFTVPDREIFVVMGLSGSGKSTLVRCINRLIEPTKGRIFVDNEDILGMSQNALITFRRKQMSMIFQSFAIFPFRNVFDNVKFGLEIQKEKKEIIEEKVLQTLELVGLAEWKDAFPSELSGGMQQRVGTARALVNDPDILLMDEPFSALDPLIRNHMQDELLDLQKRVGKTIIFITHDFNEALKVGDRCAILKDGRVIQMGTALEILRHPANEFVLDFSRDINRLNLLTAKDVMLDGDVSVIDLERDSPDRALELMKAHKIVCCCIKNQSRLEGIVSFDSINAAVSKKEATLKRVPIEQIPRESIVPPGLLVKDLCSIMSKSDIPVMVIDSDEKVLGIITRRSLFGVLGEEQAGTSLAQ